MAGIDDVARAAGVSPSTASRALSGVGGARIAERTVQRVQEAAKALGYVPSSSAYTLATGLNRNVGVVLPYLERWYFSALLAGIESHLIRAGHDLTLYNFSGSAEQRAMVFDDFLPRRRVDALITASVLLDDSELGRLRQVGKPVLSIGGPVEDAPTLSIDNRAAARTATEHLIGLGHTRIGMLGGSAATERDFRHPEARHHGFRDALGAAGLAAADRWFVPTDFTLPGGHAAALRVLDGADRPSALLAVSDEVAFGALLAARDLGLDVPGDVSVIGIDGHDLAEFFGLTTLAQRPRDQGVRAAELALEMVADRPAVTGHVDWPVELVVRSTTGAPRTGG